MGNSGLFGFKSDCKKNDLSIPCERQAKSQFLGNFFWKPYFGLVPIHVCGHSLSAVPTRMMGYVLKPLGIEENPVSVYKKDELTIIQIESDNKWMVYECGQIARWAFQPLNIAKKLPVKLYQDGAKTIIQIEANDGIFCNCNIQYIDPADNTIKSIEMGIELIEFDAVKVDETESAAKVNEKEVAVKIDEAEAEVKVGEAEPDVKVDEVEIEVKVDESEVEVKVDGDRPWAFCLPCVLGYGD